MDRDLKESYRSAAPQVSQRAASGRVRAAPQFFSRYVTRTVAPCGTFTFHKMRPRNAALKKIIVVQNKDRNLRSGEPSL